MDAANAPLNLPAIPRTSLASLDGVERKAALAEFTSYYQQGYSA
jgi:hypothetical protein